MSRNRESDQNWNTAEAADNVDTAITITPVASQKVSLATIFFGYDATPTATPKPKIIVTVDGVEFFSLPVTQSGPGYLPFPETLNKKFGEGDVVVITLEAGGTSIQGSLVTMHYLGT